MANSLAYIAFSLSSLDFQALAKIIKISSMEAPGFSSAKWKESKGNKWKLRLLGAGQFGW